MHDSSYLSIEVLTNAEEHWPFTLESLFIVWTFLKLNDIMEWESKRTEHNETKNLFLHKFLIYENENESERAYDEFNSKERENGRERERENERKSKLNF